MDNLKTKLYTIIFETDTRAGKIFDITLLVIILLSVFLVILDSVPEISKNYHDVLVFLELAITGVFTLEYILRIIIVKRPLRYIFSFYGIIDFLAVIPTYLGLLTSGYHRLLVIRSLRLLRVFRILKLTRYSAAGRTLARVVWTSREKIGVFILFVFILVTILGTLMYLIEGESSGFESIPISIYWAVVTLTTVGYGDLSPVTPLGRCLATVIMLTGYSIIVVPAGIVTAEIIRPTTPKNTKVCSSCLYNRHDDDAAFCKKCGNRLNSN
jgi:voltage-gated potassium channel